MLKERKPLVLIVDDIQSNVEFVTEVLELEDLTMLSANDGQTAIEITKSNKPDLILLDISMPDMDGYEVCEILKNDPTTKDIPIIFLTARVQKEDMLHGFKIGGVDYIVKPFNFNELISRVKTHVDLKLKTEKLKNINNELEQIVEERTQQVRQAYTELKKTNADLVRANSELSKLDKAKTEFVLHINHELRTPLNGIQGYISILAEEFTQEPYQGYINSIESMTNRLIKVAELSLLFTELKINQNHIELNPVNFHDCLNAAINCQEPELKNIEIVFENPFDNAFILAESKLLQSCLLIVIDNAIKYSPDHDFITIKVNRDQENIEVSVIDNGPGFSHKAMGELFEFFSADNLQYQKYGFGVGLATAKIILDLIKGEITINNKEPHGAVVKLSFKEYVEKN